MSCATAGDPEQSLGAEQASLRSALGQSFILQPRNKRRLSDAKAVLRLRSRGRGPLNLWHLLGRERYFRVSASDPPSATGQTGRDADEGTQGADDHPEPNNTGLGVGRLEVHAEHARHRPNHTQHHRDEG